MPVANPNMDSWQLDAYGHLNYVVGYSDECVEEIPDMMWVALAAKLDEEEYENLKRSQNREMGDWLACADFQVFNGYVGWHVVVNSDSAGYIETIAQGVYTIEDARRELPGLLDRMDDICRDMLIEEGAWLTPSEIEDNKKSIERWKRDVKEALWP